MTYKHANYHAPDDGLTATHADRIPEVSVEVPVTTPSILHGTVHVDEAPEFKIEDGACRGLDSNIFYPEKPEIDAKIKKAIDICRSCAIIDACLEDALAKREQYGIRGGTTDRERRNIVRRRSRLAKIATSAETKIA